MGSRRSAPLTLPTADDTDYTSSLYLCLRGSGGKAVTIGTLARVSRDDIGAIEGSAWGALETLNLELLNPKG